MDGVSLGPGGDPGAKQHRHQKVEGLMLDEEKRRQEIRKVEERIKMEFGYVDGGSDERGFCFSV